MWAGEVELIKNGSVADPKSIGFVLIWYYEMGVLYDNGEFSRCIHNIAFLLLSTNTTSKTI